MATPTTEVLSCEYRRYRNAEPCGKPTRRTVGDKAICSSCARLNGGVAEAFRAGEPASSASGNLRSRTNGDGRAVLESYGVAIAIRRESDGAIFTDGHQYSVTTSQHQNEIRERWHDGVSFAALDNLLGPDWWKTARIVEQAPTSCESAFCREANNRDVEAWRAMSYRVKVGERTRPAHGYECSDDCPPEHEGKGGTWHPQAYGTRTVKEDVYETRWHDGEPVEYPDFRCLFPNLDRGSEWERERRREALIEAGATRQALDGPHAVTIENGEHGPYTLLEAVDPLTGRYVGVLCGFDSGKSDGTGSQLFAAILPRDSARDVDAALAALNPFVAFQDRYGRSTDEPATPEDVKRQGDLFFRPVASACRCPCHWTRDGETETEAATRAEACKRAGILNRDGTIRKRHGCHVAGNGSVPAALEAQACKRALADGPSFVSASGPTVRVDGLELPDAGGRHVATYAAMTPNRKTFVRGMVRHPQHRTLMLRTWHECQRSRAVRAMSAEYRSWRGGGRRAYGD